MRIVVFNAADGGVVFNAADGAGWACSRSATANNFGRRHATFNIGIPYSPMTLTTTRFRRWPSNSA